jgi:hexosaminidase
MEEGNQTHPSPHHAAAQNPGPCYDVHDDDPMFKHVLGVEACLWGEGKNASNIHLVAWPGALALAERLWSAREINDAAVATPRMLAQMERLKRRGVPVRPEGAWLPPGY